MMNQTDPTDFPAGLTRVPEGRAEPAEGAIFHSRGVVLISGPDAGAAADAARRVLARAPALRVVVFAPGINGIAALPKSVMRVGGPVVSVQGHLGAFTATAPVGGGKQEDAGIFSPNPDRQFDLVLDLFARPLLNAAVPPIGYFAVGNSEAALARVLEKLPTLVGRFHKPRFFEYQATLCQHQVNGVTGCTRCLSVCAAQAIRASAGAIEVDPYLCQACASCALVCPSGALTVVRPAAAELASGLVRPRGEAGKDILLVHDAEGRDAACADEWARVERMEVNPLPAFGEALWLQALAQGFAAVRLVLAPPLPALTRDALQAKVAEVRAILAGIGRDPDAVATLEIRDLAAALRRAALQRATHVPATSGHAGVQGKRAGLLAAIDALARKNLRQDALALPAQAPFDRVTVDARRCTLCLACANICPTRALGGQIAPAPLLAFKESLCVQCGLCRAACPEQAISLQARFVPEPARRDEVRVIARDEQVACSRCSTPFIGRHFLERSIKMMQARPGALPGAADFLRLCPSCRQRGTTQT